MKPQRKCAASPPSLACEKSPSARLYCADMPGRSVIAGLEAVAALIAVEPVFFTRVGKDRGRRDAGVECELSRAFDARLALCVGQAVAARAHDLTRLPAARQILRRRRRADRGSGFVRLELGEIAELLAVAVTGEHFDQPFAVGIVICAGKRRGECRARRCVDSPRETVGDDEVMDARCRAWRGARPGSPRSRDSLRAGCAGVGVGGGSPRALAICREVPERGRRRSPRPSGPSLSSPLTSPMPPGRVRRCRGGRAVIGRAGIASSSSPGRSRCGARSGRRAGRRSASTRSRVKATRSGSRRSPAISLHCRMLSMVSRQRSGVRPSA